LLLQLTPINPSLLNSAQKTVLQEHYAQHTVHVCHEAGNSFPKKHIIIRCSCREGKRNAMQSPISHVTRSTVFTSQLFVPTRVAGDGAPVLVTLSSKSWKG